MDTIGYIGYGFCLAFGLALLICVALLEAKDKKLQAQHGYRDEEDDEEGCVRFILFAIGIACYLIGSIAFARYLGNTVLPSRVRAWVGTLFILAILWGFAFVVYSALAGPSPRTPDAHHE